MKKSRLVLGLSAGLLAMVLVIVALLPSIISSDMMKPLVIGQANRRLPGQLQLESFSVSWFGGIKGQGIVYDNQTDGLLAQVSEIRTDKGLLGLMVAGGELGTVQIADPTLVVFLSDTPAPREPQQTKPAPESTPSAPKDALIPAFYGKFEITNGSLVTATADGKEKAVARRLDLILNAPDPQTPLTYRFSVESGDGSGQASGEGTLVVPAGKPLNLQKIQADSKLRIENWELEDVFAIIAPRLGIPSAKGRLNASASLTGSHTESVAMKGQMTIKKLQLQGGPLGSDTPAVRDLVIDLDVATTSRSISLNHLTFHSSLANGSIRGIVADANQNRLSGKADVDLAEVFAQLPASLKLREDTKITNGRMALAASIESAETSTVFDGDARIDRLQGISAGKNISWNKPVTVKARGEIGQQGLQLENLSLRSSFLTADGQGDMRRMHVDLAADLREALAELRKFVEIKQWDGGGKLKLALKLNEKAENLNQAEVRLSIDDFVLTRDRRPILARQVIRADLDTEVEVAKVAANSRLRRPSLKIQSSVASGTVTARDVASSAAQSIPNATELKLDGSIDLQELSSLLKNLDLLSPQTLLAGQSKIITSGSLKEGLLALETTQIDTQKLIYRQDNKTIREHRIILTTRGQIDLKNRSLLLAPVDIDGQAGKIHIPELRIADWTDVQKNMKANGRADLDLNQLAQGYGDHIQLPENTQLSGNGRFDFKMDFSDPKTQYLNLQGNVAPFKLTSPKLPAISEKTVTLGADIHRSPDGRQMTIKNLELNADALSLKASGTLKEAGKNKVLDVSGTMTPDMKLVSDYLKKSGQSRVSFSGKKATPFTIKLISQGDRWEDPLRHLDFAGALHVADIEAYGMKLAPNDVPIRVAGAAAGAKLESPANGGQLNFQPVVDMRRDPYILSFTENIDLLRDVQVTQGLIDGLLSAIHPLFKDAVVPDGLLGLNMKHFSWPLVEKQKNKATFAGTLRLNGVRLNSTPFMAGLLNMMGIRERQLSLADQDIAFEAKDGRIELSPVQLEAEGYQMNMHGSIGFDNTLDFIARIPVTEKMVGGDAYRFLQGTTIKVPIRGTASKPHIDEKAFQAATGDLMQQALRKNLEQGAENLLKNLLKK